MYAMIELNTNTFRKQKFIFISEGAVHIMSHNLKAVREAANAISDYEMYNKI